MVSQIWKKDLSITKTLYFGYQIIFIFNNVKSYIVFANNFLQVENMSKKLEKV